MMPCQRFAWTVPAGEGMGHIPVPFDQCAVFGSARPPVVVTLNGYSYRSTIAIMSGETFVPARRSHREAAGLAAGETVEVMLSLDTAPRTVALPDDAARAVEAAALMPIWAALSYTNQREHAEAIEGAKRAQTRARRIAALVAFLKTRASPSRAPDAA